MKISDKPYICK